MKYKKRLQGILIACSVAVGGTAFAATPSASMLGNGVMYSAMLATMDGNDPAGQVAVGDIGKTGIHHHVGEFIL